MSQEYVERFEIKSVEEIEGLSKILKEQIVGCGEFSVEVIGSMLSFSFKKWVDNGKAVKTLKEESEKLKKENEGLQVEVKENKELKAKIKGLEKETSVNKNVVIPNYKSKIAVLENKVNLKETEKTELKKRIESLETEKTELKKRIEGLETENKGLKEKIEGLEEDVRAKEEDSDKTSSYLNKLIEDNNLDYNKQIYDKETEIKELKETVESKEKERKQAESVLNDVQKYSNYQDRKIEEYKECLTIANKEIKDLENEKARSEKSIEKAEKFVSGGGRGLGMSKGKIEKAVSMWLKGCSEGSICSEVHISRGQLNRLIKGLYSGEKSKNKILSVLNLLLQKNQNRAYIDKLNALKSKYK